MSAVIRKAFLAAGLALTGLAATVFSTAGSAMAADSASGFAHVSCSGGPNEIRVTVGNVKKSAGLMTAELYRNDPDGFLNKKGREFRVRYAARAPSTQFCMTAPAPGQWAIVVYHDENANQKFDKNAFGLPAEPYGVSQNPKIRLAPPPITDVLFDVADAGASVDVRLKD